VPIGLKSVWLNWELALAGLTLVPFVEEDPIACLV